MTTLESIFTDRHQKEGRDSDDCLKNILAGETYNDAYYKYELKFPLPEYPLKTYYLAKCELEKRNLFEKDGRPFIAFKVAHTMRSDMFDTFQCNVDYAIWIGDIKYNTPRLLNLCLAFPPIYILLYLDGTNVPSEITFSFHKHYFSTELRRAIIMSMYPPNGLVDGEIQYMYGMAKMSSEMQPEINKTE